jgi:hypothetical protein
MLHMRGEPLGQYFHMAGIIPPFSKQSSTLSRGYLGSWELNLGRLYLTGLEAVLANGQSASLDALFPGYSSRVFAHWCSGQFLTFEGSEFEPVPKSAVMAGSRILEFHKGVLAREWVEDANRKS